MYSVTSAASTVESNSVTALNFLSGIPDIWFHFFIFLN